MTNKRVFVFAIIISSIIILSIGCKSTDSPKNNVVKTTGPNTNYDFSPIKKRITSWVEKGYYSGASIVIVKDNQIIYEDYFGNYKPETEVYIASAGKWIVAATIAGLVDNGKLSWDDKVVKWLPEFTDVKGQATLRELLSHTSGFPDYQPKEKHSDDYQTLEEAVKHIVLLPADSAPGKEFHYGGLAMQVAGRMAEVAAGKKFEKIFQDEIAQPLEMKSTHFTPVDSTSGHNPMLAGGARSTLKDYAHFLEMISNNGVFKNKRILSAKAIKEMQSDQVKNAFVKQNEYVQLARAVNHKSIYGLGEWREELNADSKAVLISSPSWAGAYPWIDKKNNIYGFLLTHVDPKVAAKDGFSSFLSSPVMTPLTRDIINKNH